MLNRFNSLGKFFIGIFREFDIKLECIDLVFKY